jgi:Protein of unknown function (DUF1203)
MEPCCNKDARAGLIDTSRPENSPRRVTSRLRAAERLPDVDTITATKPLVQAIDPARLVDVYATGADGHGNRIESFAASGEGEPLRCCLRFAEPGEAITLISFAPFDHPSVWTEVGPVYIHATRCGGYSRTSEFPAELAAGPAVLRTYRGDDTMNYDHNTVITDRAELRPIIERLLREPDVATVHVRTLAPQCFLYAVTAA